MATYVWDERKRALNRQKHAIDFADAVAIFEGDIVTIEDDRFNYEQRRFVTLGLLRGHVIVIVHADEGEEIRIISARRAIPYERSEYFKQLFD